MSNDNTVTTSLTGGVTRVSHGAPTEGDHEAEAHAREMLRGGVSDGGAMRIEADGTTRAFGGTTRYTVGSERDLNSADILSTVRTTSSSQRPAVIEGRHIVTVGGMAMTVDSAVRAGYLEQSAPGQYRSTGLLDAERERDARTYEEQHAGNALTPSTAQAKPLTGSNLVIR